MVVSSDPGIVEVVVTPAIGSLVIVLIAEEVVVDARPGSSSSVAVVEDVGVDTRAGSP